MSRTVAAALLSLLLTRAGQPAEQGQLDSSPALFTVLAAINAAGYDADLASSSNHPLRHAVRQALAQRTIPVLEELRSFYREHQLREAAAELSQYISFALSVTDPPGFAFKYRTVDLPPDVARLRELPKLLKTFYAQAGIEELWKQAQPAFDEAIARYHEPVLRAVLEVNTYLRNPTSGAFGRRFQVYIDLLGAPHQIHTRFYADDCYIVLTPSPEPQINDIRHAYLRYLLDPMALRHGEAVLKRKALLDYVQAAPALGDHYKSDFLLLATESLIRAIESRLARRGGPQMVEEALREGLVLAPHFAEQLPAYEKQEQSMRMYFPELIESIDLRREEKRLDKVEFTAEAKVRRARSAPPPPAPVLTTAQKTMEQAEALYSERKLEAARQAFTRVLGETGEKPLHARAYYGMARIAALEKNPELAERLFLKALELGPEPQVKAWVLVYLARLADAAGEREQAVKLYGQALGVEGASEAARRAAEQGTARALQKD